MVCISAASVLKALFDTKCNWFRHSVAGNPSVPTLISPPTITGTAQGGQTLSASTGTWANSPTSFAYQWQNEGSNISGATASTYALQSTDLSALITVAVTASNGAGASLPALSPLAGLVIGTTAYYVAAAGNDSHAGTSPAAAWQTLAKVNGFAFPAGASVLFNRGECPCHDRRGRPWRACSRSCRSRRAYARHICSRARDDSLLVEGKLPTILGRTMIICMPT